MLALALVFIVSCGEGDTPYDENDSEGYTLSVKFDANGGIFATNVSVMMDSYNPSSLEESNGQVDIALLAPEDSRRGKNAFTAAKNGYFLAGWYQTVTQQTGENGETVYAYSDRWDFSSDRLTVDSDGEYSSSEPVLTLYAAWIPLFEYEFVDISTGDVLSSYVFDPTRENSLKLPQWSTQTGRLDMFDFPQKQGHTLEAVYADAQAGEAITGERLMHSGTINLENATASNRKMRLYIDYKAGDWYKIYTADQFNDNISVNGCYELMADLDFTDKTWPSSLLQNTFTGKIIGNGHKISNVTATQRNRDKMNTGLFGSIADGAVITNLTLENITLKIEGGMRVSGSSCGLLAGNISSGATLTDVAIASSTLQISAKAAFLTSDYSIGLVAGNGSFEIDYSGIECVAADVTEDRTVSVEVNGNEVTVIK